jgi:hypothetical protein
MTTRPEQEQRRGLRNAFKPHARLLARRQHAALHVPELTKIKVVEQSVNACAKILHTIQKTEEAQILSDREVARQRGVCGRDIHALQDLSSMTSCLQVFDHNRAARRFKDAEHHIDDRRLAGAVGTEQAKDLVLVHLERYVVDGDDSAVLLAKMAC